ncbi:uncharacterized protein CDV56_107162 [Aspergillus thermomutatus]|uniref:SNF2 N-terminal domain-containing protein n=1 Tax=Aspergillus thermomutatus TaxID=41047 RepID=A0A397GTH8_ASPTH|nr:uncharacterized protein CDV56_107162 [Aspergillus thermomutatus]RHZ52844.1 hypothetical protein CDV56_107162 [Aspergillus thermomutatus]
MTPVGLQQPANQLPNFLVENHPECIVNDVTEANLDEVEMAITKPDDLASQIRSFVYSKRHTRIENGRWHGDNDDAFEMGSRVHSTDSYHYTEVSPFIFVGRLSFFEWERTARGSISSQATSGNVLIIQSGYGLRRPLRLHQAFAVCWMLTTERAQNGGYLADDMGLGKTTTAIALCIISRWVRVARQAVEKSQAANNGKHLLPDDQEPDDEALSAADFPICCPCVRAGPTARYMAIELQDQVNPTFALTRPH